MRIDLKCPQCTGPMTVDQPICPSGHRYDVHDGVLVLMSEKRRAEMDEYLRLFREYRSCRKERITDPAVYDRLPFSRELKNDPVWRLRRQDARLTNRLMRNRPGSRILELGAWNCWLSHHLAIAGHDVVAADDFDDTHDGLRAVQHYSKGKWVTIRMDLDRVDLLEAEFDLIVVNRGFYMLSRPFDVLEVLKNRLAPGGRILLTGLNVFHDSTAIRDHYTRLREDFMNRYGREIAFKKFKGFMDPGDIQTLKLQGVEIRPYWRQLPATVRALIDRTRPRQCYGLFRRP